VMAMAKTPSLNVSTRDLFMPRHRRW
jgi:hypothetical protein